MGKKTFIPNWYIDKKIQGKNKTNKICITVISVINIILITLIFNNYNKMKTVNKEVVNENNTIIIETFKPNIIAIEKYKELSNFFEVNNLSYKDMVVTKENLEINMEVKSYEEYIHVIRIIENHYSIKQLVPNIKNEETIDFKIILEV